MKKKRIPAIIFNDGDYKYPSGLKVTDEDELDIKLKSGDWNTGPVDKLKNPIKKKKSADEKRAEIKRLQAELDKSDVDVVNDDPDPPKKEPEPVKDKKTTPGKKPLSHMNITELMKEGNDIGLTINEDWTKTQLYTAIRKKKG
jgi:hypothetical protein